jgi:raffinose/stachyose/melibiose transport system substrate-binding protein
LKKWSAIALTLALAVTVFAGCAGNQNNKQPQNQAGEGNNTGGAGNELSGEITFVTHRTDLVGNGVYDEYARNFNEKYPNVKVNFEGLTNYEQDIKVRLASGQAGDVLVIGGNVAASDLPNFFEPLDDIGLFDKAYFADAKTFEGKRYGITSGVSTEGIVYNKQAYAKAGITDIPKTLDEFYQVCQKLKDAGIIPIYINNGAQWPMKQWGEVLVPAVSGDPDYLNKMVDQDAPFQVDNAWGQSFSIVRTLIEKGYVEPDLSSNNWESSKVDIATGTAAMYFLGNWVINQVIGAGAAPEDIGFYPLPYDNSGKTNAVLNPDYFYVVSKNSKNKEAAKAFVKFLVDESGYDTSEGFIPVLKDRDPTLAQLAEFKSYNPTFLENVPQTSKWNEIGNKAQIGFYTGDYIQTIVVAKDLKKELDALNAKWKEAKNALGY